MPNFLRVYNTIEWKIKISLKQLFILSFKRSAIIPNHIYIKFLYFIVFLKSPDTKNPKTFNEIF